MSRFPTEEIVRAATDALQLFNLALSEAELRPSANNNDVISDKGKGK